MNQYNLSRETLALLSRIGRSEARQSVYNKAPEESERACFEVADPLLEAAGLRLVYLNQYRWFVRELSKLFRILSGPDLAFHLETCFRKWLNLGLEPRTMTLLLSDIWQRLVPATPDPTGKGGHHGARR